MADRPKLTTTAGAPVPNNQDSLSAGERGPLLLQDYQLIEKLAHQNRERIPERPVHAKGWGAYGTLTITNDISRYSSAKIFDVGKPLVIEEVFPLTATAKELGVFIERSRPIADGWIGFYWGKTIQEMEDEPGPFDKSMLAWLELFRKLNPTTAPVTQKS